MTYYWWDDAYAHAYELALLTGVRHRVFQSRGGWTIDLAHDAVMVEVCS